MIGTESSLLAIAKSGLRELGYVGDLMQEDYEFADFGASTPRVRRIDLAAFGHIPTSFESAWIGLTVGPEDAGSLRRFRALGAPQILVLHSEAIERWRMPAAGDPVFQERFPPDRLLDIFRERQGIWGQPVVARAKTISLSAEPLQLDFFDAGLVPAIEAIVRKKLDKLLSEALARALRAYQEHVAGEADLPGLYRLVFRLLAAKLLQDRGHSVDWADGSASEVVARVERYYYGSDNVPQAVSHDEVREAAWRYMRRGFHLQNVSVSTLAYIYENTLVSDETRKRQSIHGTPPEIAEYVVRRLPFEDLPRDDRRVFEPFAGHAVFLIAALGRLRELLAPGLSHEERHGYFVQMLAGMEEEPFAIEVARLSLMLADYPNPDGWQLQQQDVFSATELEDRLMEARVVLCNPPFEDFSISDRSSYTGLRSTNQAADILNRTLDHPPSLLGFVLPVTFRDGHVYREARKRLVEQYGVIELTELPDRVFAHSEAKTILLLAHGANEGRVELRCSAVERADLSRFLATGEPTQCSIATLTSTEASAMPALWRFPLESVWTALRDHPLLGSVAEAHRGVEYNLPFKENRARLVSERPSRGFALGMVNVDDGFEPFHARPRYYLNTMPRLMRRAENLRWEQPKVIVNARRLSRGPWRLAAVPDQQGLFYYQNFIGIWPTHEWTIEALAAVMNGHVANAFLDLREDRDNRIQTIKSIPIPRLSGRDIKSLTELVWEYKRLRDDLSSDLSEENQERCRELLEEIDSTVLRAYALPGDVEEDLVRHFARVERPGPPAYARRAATLPFLFASPELSSDRIEVVEPSRIDGFLGDTPDLIQLLREAISQLSLVIPDARLHLELLSDPEYGGTEQLLLAVSTNLEDDVAAAALGRFDREWWIDQVHRARGLLCIDLSAE